MNTPHAVIAGAGIGGLCAAISLARRGWHVSLFEKAELPDEAGAGLQLSPNASAILQKLGIIDRLACFALRPKAIVIRRARDAAVLARMPLEDAERRWGAPYLVVHRADLQRVLLEAAACEPAIRLTACAAVSGVEQDANNVLVSLGQAAGLSQVAGDCLIGADGVRSFVRNALRLGCERFTRKTAWRALIEASRVPVAMRGEETNLWLGRGAHLVHYPLRGGIVVNAVAIVDEGLCSGEEDPWSNPGDPCVLETWFKGWDEVARELLRSAPGWRKWPLFECAPLANWACGRVAVMGDAAHAMLPFLAQGAAQAIEDANALGTALAQHKDIAANLRAYQAMRLERATRVQTESRRLGAIYHLSRPAALFRDTALRAMGGVGMLARYEWLYAGGNANRPLG